jgi:thiosulfate reductase cytochrome b subunit
MNDRTSAQPERLLVWRTRASSRRFLLATVYSLGIAVASGVALLAPFQNSHVTLVALAVHLASGVLALGFFVPYLFLHLADGREKLRYLLMPWRLMRQVYQEEGRGHRLLGYILMWSVFIVSASGIAIAMPALQHLIGHLDVLSFGKHVWLLDTHRASSIVFVLFLLLHFPKKGAS